MKVLVIRFLQIGDAVISSSLCTTIKRSYPESEVHYLTYDVNAPLFDHHRDIDRVLTILPNERTNPIRYLMRAIKISKENYDIIIDATSTLKSELVSFFSWSTKIRIGRMKAYRGFSYTHKAARNTLIGDKLNQRLCLLQPLKELDYTFSGLSEMTLNISGAESRAMKSKMQAQGVKTDRLTFIFSVSAKFPQKKWNLLHMRDVIAHCLRRYDVQIILFSGLPHEQQDVDYVHKLLDNDPRVFSKIKTDGLRELAALISIGSVFIGNEGGPRHIAHALGLATASVFSPSSNKREWLIDQGDRHQGIGWEDTSWGTVIPAIKKDEVEYEFGDSTYFKLYNNIKPTDFIPIIDSVIANQLSKTELVTVSNHQFEGRQKSI